MSEMMSRYLEVLLDENIRTESSMLATLDPSTFPTMDIGMAMFEPVDTTMSGLCFIQIQNDWREHKMNL